MGSVPPTLKNMNAGERKAWQDVKGRASMAAGLILNEPPGMLQMMMSASPGGASMQPFGEDILSIARAMSGY